ncbi:E3 ubiquitin-protein ligase KEG-like [Cynara cardunculus var. scolymus]|uniref:E3 ubiquitin-protein ligase KEG-like n=1 Tax=Cynara cardunculus var. scolymus TaxID=59895 RepID=UPI000D6234DB|nr:E3 ubiquitin-protein ligase KEG-like [Cynara cardunculus var. scolymus]XP_024978882.1 E3 ubiquitin-protein ligase KEG-like [Cynara cardunculus var. scolymus]XP_024978883.1 E3 ubiquitin-protein ligase KEG-like [Cynara cardunculus var. scolymus]
MAEQAGSEPSPPSFDYMLYEGDPEHLRTVVATPSEPSPRIDPSLLKLKHRIGHGPFGDVWLATHHQSAHDYDEYHEVAMKMLHPVKEEDMPKFLVKFEELFLRFRKLPSVCWLHGISVISGKASPHICIAMKFYEGSVGDRMAKLKGGKLPLPDVLRYGVGLAKGIHEVHSLNILVLNIKPTNLLLDEHDQVVLGDFGIPFLLLGLQLPDPDMSLRLGSPNYMAPEQWQPEVRGPISIETDSWGFGCCILEMLTGVQPWFGKSVGEIYNSVVLKQEKPQLPSGLPPAVENVLNGCFEYDLRNRPLIGDILRAFESSLDAVFNEGEWIGLGSRISPDRTLGSGYSTWFLTKDHLQVGDVVRSRKTHNNCKPQNMAVAEGTVVGLEKDTDRDGFVLVRVQGIHNPLRVNITTLERVTSGLAAGVWVHLVEEKRNHSSIGILHSIERDGSVSVGFIGLETLWEGQSSQLQMAKPFCVGQFVRLKRNVITPRFPWLHKREGTWDTGKISQILPNGCLIVRFPGRFVFKGERSSFLADPAEVEHVSFDTCPTLVDKFQHVEDYHWAVRPLTIAFGVLTAMKFGFFVGHSVGARIKKGRTSRVHSGGGGGGNQDGQNSGGKSKWLPSPVANMLSREGASPAVTAR